MTGFIYTRSRPAVLAACIAKPAPRTAFQTKGKRDLHFTGVLREAANPERPGCGVLTSEIRSRLAPALAGQSNSLAKPVATAAAHLRAAREQ